MMSCTSRFSSPVVSLKEYGNQHEAVGEVMMEQLHLLEQYDALVPLEYAGHAAKIIKAGRRELDFCEKLFCKKDETSAP
jgi:hypothetical protein